MLHRMPHPGQHATPPSAFEWGSILSLLDFLGFYVSLVEGSSRNSLGKDVRGCASWCIGFRIVWRKVWAPSIL